MSWYLWLSLILAFPGSVVGVLTLFEKYKNKHKRY